MYSAIRVVKNNESRPLAHEVAFKKRTTAMSAPMLRDGRSCPKTNSNKLCIIKLGRENEKPIQCSHNDGVNTFSAS